MADPSNDRLLQRLQNFTTRHTSHHRPLAFVTSGGTAADLEVHAVRFLDNFSTGLRGAVSVEQFLKRGYAVIHLQREGSASPFGRIVADALAGNNRKGAAHQGPTFESMGELFDCEGFDNEGEEDDIDLDLDLDLDNSNNNNVSHEQTVDPWMYMNGKASSRRSNNNNNNKRRGYLSLHPRLIHSRQLQSALRERNRIVQQGLLLTLRFRTVEDYLEKLQLCARAVNSCGTLGLVYLAAAVSDFYIPKEKKVLHKIQSRDYGFGKSSSIQSSSSDTNADNENNSSMEVGKDHTLTITLHPVPKAIPALRTKWCPSAFVVSFKLETDPSILRQKSVLAIDKNNVHLVIGNELATRHEKVYILSRPNNENDAFTTNYNDPGNNVTLTPDSNDNYGAADLPDGYHVALVTGSHNNTISGSNAIDALEYATIEQVVRHHFHYISRHIGNNGQEILMPPQQLMQSQPSVTASAAARHKSRMEESHRQLVRERVKIRAKELAWNMAGSAIGLAISYGIGRMLQRQVGGAR